MKLFRPKITGKFWAHLKEETRRNAAGKTEILLGKKKHVMCFFLWHFLGWKREFKFTFDRRKIFFPGDFLDRWGKIAKENAVINVVEIQTSSILVCHFMDDTEGLSFPYHPWDWYIYLHLVDI